MRYSVNGLSRTDKGTIVPLLLLVGLIATAIANVKMAQPAPPVAICGTILGLYCGSILPLQTFVAHLPLLSLALALVSLLLAVLGTYCRRHAAADRASMLARVLQLAPGILLVVVGLLACVLVMTVWPATAHPLVHPY